MLEVAITIKAWFSLGAPEPMPDRFTVCNPALMTRFKSEMTARVGTSFTEVTVTRKVLLALLPLPSFTDSVTREKPD